MSLSHAHFQFPAADSTDTLRGILGALCIQLSGPILYPALCPIYGWLMTPLLLLVIKTHRGASSRLILPNKEHHIRQEREMIQTKIAFIHPLISSFFVKFVHKCIHKMFHEIDVSIGNQFICSTSGLVLVIDIYP